MASGVTPKQIYQALVNAGASTIQAIGIMANAINESTLNPEAVGDQGTSFGIVQEHGGQYATLVSGNPASDLANQVNVLAVNGGFQAASGSTPAEAAGNFAANYERCVGCQPGGAQYNQRVANAATVAGWVSSGQWPTSAGAATAGASSSSGAAAGPECALSLGGQHIGILFGHGPTLPSACLIRKTEVRAVLGAMILVGGGLVMLPGLAIILAYGFRASGAARVVTQVASVTPVGRAARAAGGGRYRVTERRPVGGEMGGTRTIQYRARRNPGSESLSRSWPRRLLRGYRGSLPHMRSSSHRSRRSRRPKMSAILLSCAASESARSSSFCSMTPPRRADRATMTAVGMRMPATSATRIVSQSTVLTV